MSVAGEEVSRARAWLSRAALPGAAAMWWFVEAEGPVDAARALRVGTAPGEVIAELLPVPALPTADRVEADLADARVLGVRLVTPEDVEWPAVALAPLEQATAAGAAGLAPPLALWARGRLPVGQALSRVVSVIGARAATAYGGHVAADLGYGLAAAGWTVLSGGAYGVDGSAHVGALRAGAEGASTVAVLPCGLARPYPAGHVSLLEEIASDGLLLSEWPPDVPARRHRFTVRNRLLAAAGAATVVVEALARSSALPTARDAARLGRQVFAVPGPVTSALSDGPHALLRDRTARLATGTADVLAALAS